MYTASQTSQPSSEQHSRAEPQQISFFDNSRKAVQVSADTAFTVLSATPPSEAGAKTGGSGWGAVHPQRRQARGGPISRDGTDRHHTQAQYPSGSMGTIAAGPGLSKCRCFGFEGRLSFLFQRNSCTSTLAKATPNMITGLKSDRTPVTAAMSAAPQPPAHRLRGLQ